MQEVDMDDEKFQKMWTTYKYRRVCCVPSCRSKPSVDATLKMHHFPKDLDMARMWETAVGVPRTRALSVCSKHFLPSDYHPASPRLRKGSVPSVNLGRSLSPQFVLDHDQHVLYVMVADDAPVTAPVNVDIKVLPGDAAPPESVVEVPSVPFSVVTKMQKEGGKHVVYAGPSPKRRRAIVITSKLPADSKVTNVREQS